MQRNLPAIRPASSLTTRTESPAAMITAENRPKVIRAGVAKLLISFPMPGMSAESGQMLSEAHFEAVEGFPLAVAAFSHAWLLFHNPRNRPEFSCPPTPQDVREACQRTDRLWRRWVVWYWLGGKWAETPADEFLKKNNGDLLERYSAARQSGDPSEPGCIVPRDLQSAYMREEIERQLPDIEAADDRARKGYGDALLLTIPDDVFERIPQEAFPDGALEKIRSIRAGRAEKARKAAEHEAYLNSLPEDVRAVRSTVAYASGREDWTEAQIMAETQKRHVMVESARAEAAAKGERFYRFDFEDGETYFAPRTYGRAEREMEEKARLLKMLGHRPVPVGH